MKEIKLDEQVTRAQLIDIARQYRPRVCGTTRYFPHQGDRETARRLKKANAHGHADRPERSAG